MPVTSKSSLSPKSTKAGSPNGLYYCMSEDDNRVIMTENFTCEIHLTCGISSLLHSVNLILFTLLLVHLILHISPHHSHHFDLTIYHSLDLSLQT